MCGIAGIFAYADSAPSANQQELLVIRERMYARGPDGAGLWLSADGRVGLAHRRLAIIDLSDAGAQPMVDPQTGNQIVFNGEIYNFRQLRAELEARGTVFRSQCDTEVLLKLYAVHGQAMLDKLRGMYAFAIWDQANQGIFLARDPFGIKPLYLADDGKTLRFASQVKALLAGGAINTAPEPAGHVGFFLWGHVPEPYTLYKGIRSLPAGTCLWLESQGRRKQTTFFNVTSELCQPDAVDSPITAQEAKEQLHEALRDSVGHHLVADVPVGVFLSSGLDSTTLAALAAEQLLSSVLCPLSSGIRTLTLGFKEFANTITDEVPLAELVACHLGAQHHTQWVSREDFVAQYDHLLESMDQPTIDGVNSYFVCKAAHDAGLKVALSGLGGDELFAGYPSFQHIPRLVQVLRPFAALPWLGRTVRYAAAPILKNFTSPKAAGLLEYGGEYAGAYLLRRGLFMPWELPQVLDTDLLREGCGELATMASLRRTVQGLENPRTQVMALEFAWYMRNQLLRDTDWASMAHSLEVRVPLVDVALMRVVARLLRHGHAPGKQDMSSSPAIPLPSAVLHRKKTGFSIPVREWLLQMSGMQQAGTMRGARAWAYCLMQHHRGYETTSFFCETN
ncbi:MAG: asparagine synthase (glutamine-hydrolyzing) [Desulfobulbaceae bacterium A2]|nr:MAG: asparagine synthase (glutamine-hydrolyzing) [Desulfobulbaceae bacterium A2]